MSIRDYAEAAFRLQLGEFSSFEVIPNSRHYLFRCRTQYDGDYVVKIYRQTATLFNDIEITAYSKLRGAPFIKKCYASAAARNASPAYMITEYVEGSTLLELIRGNRLDVANERLAVDGVVDFVRYCAKVKVRGFGDLNDDLAGACPTWLDFLDGYLDRVRALVSEVRVGSIRALMTKAMYAADRYRAEEIDFLSARPTMFAPIDMNMANFLVDRDQRLIVLDLKTFIGADPLFVVAEWMSHTHGTSRFDRFMQSWGGVNGKEEKCLRYYALICNLDVLLYIVNNGTADPQTSCPWGNHRTFIDLIDEHSTRLA